jgi:RNA polymerase sigma-70 factor, ECF subfamily
MLLDADGVWPRSCLPSRPNRPLWECGSFFRGSVNRVTADESRFVEVYESFFRLVYGYCMRRTTPDKVDDAVADTFLVAWRRIGDVPDGAAALPWLYGVAFRVLNTQWRARSRRSQLETKLDSVGVVPVSSVEDYVVVGEEYQQVLQALSRLRVSDQEIIRLSLWEELSHADIGVIFDISPDAAKQRFYEARRHLGREFNRLESKQVNPPATQKGGGRW